MALSKVEKRSREVGAVASQPGRGRERIGLAKRGGFELQAAPGLHLPAYEHGRAGLGGVYGREDGPGKCRGEERGGPTSTASPPVLVQLDDGGLGVSIGVSGRDERYGASPSQRGLPPFLGRRKKQMLT